jgi:hypothetical protein
LNGLSCKQRPVRERYLAERFARNRRGRHDAEIALRRTESDQDSGTSKQAHLHEVSVRIELGADK